jgi:stage II sporulation protein M
MKLLDKLLNNIRFDKKYVLFSLILVILGIITGSLFIVILNSTDKNLVIEYISSFTSNIKNSSINNLDLLKNSLISNYIVIFILLIIGFTSFLFPINVLVLFYKSFIIGFSLSSFILTYGIKGSLLSIFYILPHLLINIFIFCLLTAFTLKISINMIKCVIKRKDVNMRQYFNKYLSIIIMSIIIITLTSLYEAYVAPYLLKLIVNLII